MAKLEPNHFFATPEDMRALQDFLETYGNGEERAAATMGAMLAWNLACKLANEPPAPVESDLGT